MSDKSDISTTEEEKLTNDLLALLYADGDVASAEDSAIEEELAGFRQVRSLFSELPEEAPSIAGANQLLAQAAQHAPTPKAENPGFFAWLSGIFMPIAQYPGLAAVASLVLVGGVAGALYLGGGLQIAEPTVTGSSSSTDRAAVELEKSVGDEAIPAEESPEIKAEVSPRDGNANSEWGAGVVAASPAPELKAQTVSRGKSSKATQQSNSAKLDLADSIGASKTNKEKRQVASPPKNAKQPRRRAPSKSSPLSTVDFDEPVAPVQAPTSPAPTSPAYEEDADEDADEDAEAGADKAPNVEDLHRRAAIAAKKGDCALVKKLGQQIRRLDSGYYDRTYLSDSAIRGCSVQRSKKSKNRK